MYCSNCGEKVTEAMNHCPNCGKPLPKPDNIKDFTYITGSARKSGTGKRRSKEYMECLYGITQGVDILYLAGAIEEEFADVEMDERPESVLILGEEEIYLASLKGAKAKKYSSADKLPDKLKALADVLTDKNGRCVEIYAEYIKFLNPQGEEILTQYQNRKPMPEKRKEHSGSLHMYDEPMPYKPGNPRRYEKLIIKIGIAAVICVAVISVYLMKRTEPVQDGRQKKAAVTTQQNQQNDQRTQAAETTGFSGEKAEENKTNVKEAETSKSENADYIFSDSSKRYLKEEELQALTKDQLSIARNEIFARLGRKFSTEKLDQYFRSKEWYAPLYEPDEFDAKGDSVLNIYEKANVTLISEYEKKMGYR